MHVHVHGQYLVLLLELLVEMIVLIFQHIDYYKVKNSDQPLHEDVDILLGDLDEYDEIVERATFLSSFNCCYVSNSSASFYILNTVSISKKKEIGIN